MQTTSNRSARGHVAQFGWFLALFVPLAVMSAQAAAADGDPQNAEAEQRPAPDTENVDFKADVWPIFRAHCLDCHGPGENRGGLRLDTREFADQGGATGARILGGDLSSNHLYERIIDEDPAFRMPKGADALSAEEVDVVRRWIEQGTPWPSTRETTIRAVDSGLGNRLLRWYIRFDNEWLVPLQHEGRHLRPFWITLIVICAAILIVTRARSAVKKNPQIGGRSFAMNCSKLRRRWLIAAGCVVALLGWVQHLRYNERQLNAQIDELRDENAILEAQEGRTTQIPMVRPRHPRRLSGTYYRGNCERNPSLFNYGNYQTASMSIALCDRSGTECEYGEPVPPEGFAVRVDIKRAPGSTPRLFTSTIAQACYLAADDVGDSQNADSENEDAQTPKKVPMKVVDNAEAWTALYPIDFVPGQPTSPVSDVPWTSETPEVHGVVYVYYGNVQHFGVAYRLDVDDGRIGEQTEIWMGAVFVPGGIDRPSRGISFAEWFDYRPLPLVEGMNTKDPALLGIEEHSARAE